MMSLVLWIQLKVGQSEQERGEGGRNRGGGVDLHTAVRPEGVGVGGEKDTTQPHQEIG